MTKYRAIRAYRCKACGAVAEKERCPCCTSREIISFDSKREAKEYDNLRFLQTTGQIFDLRLQVPYPVVVAGKKITTWVADFVYVDTSGEHVVDVKGFETPVFKIKRKLVEALYGITVEVVK